MCPVLIQTHSIKTNKQKSIFKAQANIPLENTGSDFCVLRAEELTPVECNFLYTLWEQNTGAEGKRKSIKLGAHSEQTPRKVGDQFPPNATSSKTQCILLNEPCPSTTEHCLVRALLRRILALLPDCEHRVQTSVHNVYSPTISGLSSFQTELTFTQRDPEAPSISISLLIFLSISQYLISHHSYPPLLVPLSQPSRILHALIQRKHFSVHLLCFRPPPQLY